MAQKIKGITIEIGGDTTNLDKALGEVNSKTRQLQSELKGVNSLLKMDPKNVTLLKQKQDLLNQSIANTREKLNTLKIAQIQVQEQFDKGQITEEQYRDFQREIVATENKLKSLTIELRNFGSIGAQQIAAVGQKMQDVGGKIESAGKKLSLLSAGSTVALTAVSKGAIDFETAFTGVTKTVDGTDEQLSKIKQGLLDLSKATSSSSTDIAAVAEAAGQLGVKTENILAFTETMVRLGDSTNMSADEAATAIAQLYNIMGSDINTVDQFGAAIVALGNNAATTEADIVNMASRIASSGTQVGLTEQEVLALSTTLASVGLEAEGGGSAISAVITKIDKDVALNTDSLKTWADVAGMSVKDFKILWENDAMSAIQKVVGGMGDAKAGGENLNIILDELGVTSLRQTDTMKRLSGASELMADMVNISNNAWKENSALTNESSKRYETTAAKITQMKNTVTELCVKLGDILLPILNKIISAISKFTNWLTNLNPAAQKVVLVILAIVSALGPFLIILAKLISSIGTIMTVVPKLIEIIKIVKTAFAAFNSTLLSNPISLIVIAITALIAAISLLWNHCEWFRNMITTVFGNITQGFAETINNIKSIFSIDNITSHFIAVLTSIKNVFSSIPNWFKEVFTNAWSNVKNVFSSGGKIFSGIKEGIDTTLKNIVNKIISGTNKIIAFPFNSINTMLNKIRNISFLDISPFKKLWSENPLKIPQIPLLRTGGSIIGDGEAIMAEAGSPEMITMMNGKAIVRPLTSIDRKEVISNTNNSGSNTFNFYSPEALTPSEERRKWRQEVQYQKLIHG